MYQQEMANPAPAGAVANAGALRSTAYGPGQTQGAFLAYWTDTITLIFYDTANHHKVGAYYLHSYEALCNWHDTFSGSWRYLTPLWQALQYADIVFNSPGANMPRIEPSATVQTPAGTVELFNPSSHLYVYGSATLLNP